MDNENKCIAVLKNLNNKSFPYNYLNKRIYGKTEFSLYWILGSSKGLMDSKLVKQTYHRVVNSVINAHHL